ncbi:PREDICTED: E3 ubiquitin-protein ligase RNF8-B-like isoform X3 [Wasmannia auropunctata]|uniref:E3 ubiquitin-protein ligase RNF8-B-like isoform X3 n=1 Tax=Wasmannia auropunctata TaxID=64793 RepID=UPI0005F0765E|nr:PREDICTED: E3 ubiquitin-protein ligase RNF8-B-like isoform X3 [Wasmannia auropunctata]XP_011686584.1 PREDICTED: E3 ubiquitin-protein ligase RNF8-B-like isoform X3 [Wasmannia auropunctata]
MEQPKRAAPNEELKILEPVLIKVGTDERIHIDKNEFKIGRARDNDEIILDTMISRKHCVFRCEGQDEWTIKNLSSSTTIMVNNQILATGEVQTVRSGDIIQLSFNETFKYVFTLTETEHRVKKPRIDEKILDSVLVKQKTFAESQESQRKELRNKLEIKQKEQIVLKQQLEDLLSQQAMAKDDKENLLKQIAVLEDKIKACNTQEENLNSMYSQLLEKLENERLQFEARINEEKQKWQEALEMSKQEKEMLEVKMKDQMEKWREEQQAEWKKMMESKVKEEKDIQAQLLNEKIMLEAKLKETEQALKEQEAKAETSQAILNINADETVASTSECIFVNLNGDQYEVPQYEIIDTIDLTELSQNILETNIKESVLGKVSDIMDEQLTCSICSELFVNATTLNCAHTFCHHCIKSWNRRRKDCPVCRKPVISMIRSLVLDNFIESMIDNLPPELKNKRKELIQERQASEKNKRP